MRPLYPQGDLVSTTWLLCKRQTCRRSQSRAWRDEDGCASQAFELSNCSVDSCELVESATTNKEGHSAARNEHPTFAADYLLDDPVLKENHAFCIITALLAVSSPTLPYPIHSPAPTLASAPPRSPLRVGEE